MGKEADGLGIGPLQVVLQVKIEIVTIDRNYQEAISFEQMKIAGKCPLIYILYKPGHYDIIYSKTQSDADGFDSINESFTQYLKFPNNYRIENPDLPFFIQIPKNGQECPKQDYKDFQIQFDFPYQSTKDVSQYQANSYFNAQEKVTLTCFSCNIQKDSKKVIELQCQKNICTQCMAQQISRQTNGYLDLKNQQNLQQLSCQYCSRQYTKVEVVKFLDKYKLKKV